MSTQRTPYHPQHSQSFNSALDIRFKLPIREMRDAALGWDMRYPMIHNTFKEQNRSFQALCFEKLRLYTFAFIQGYQRWLATYLFYHSSISVT